MMVNRLIFEGPDDKHVVMNLLFNHEHNGERLCEHFSEKASKLLQYLTVLENENKRLFEDLDVCVTISTDAPSVGPTPTVSIRSAYSGFDWDSGKFILCPESILCKKCFHDECEEFEKH